MYDDNQHPYIEADESLFCHCGENGKKIWLIGFINTATKYFSIEAITKWSSPILGKNIRNHVVGNSIITYRWSAIKLDE